MMHKDQPGQLGDLLSAYLDDELDEVERAEVAARLLSDPAVARQLAELRETQGLLRSLPRERAPADFAQDVLAAVERRELLGPEVQRSSRTVTRRSFRPLQAAAAAVLLTGGAGLLIFWQVQRQEQIQLTDAGSFRKEMEKNAPTGARLKHPASAQDHVETQALGPLAFSQAQKPDDAAASPSSAETDRIRADGDRLTLFGGSSPEPPAGAYRQNAAPSPVAADSSAARFTDEILESQAEGERLELTLNFADTARREQFSREFDAELVDRGYLNLEDPVHRARIVEPLVQPVFSQSIRTSTESTPVLQYVVSAPPEALASMIDRITTATTSTAAPESVESRVGEVKALGADNARTLARGLTAKKLAEAAPLPVEPPPLLALDTTAPESRPGPPAPSAAAGQPPTSGPEENTGSAFSDGAVAESPVRSSEPAADLSYQVLDDSRNQVYQAGAKSKAAVQRKGVAGNAVLLLNLKATPQQGTPDSQPAKDTPNLK